MTNPSPLTLAARIIARNLEGKLPPVVSRDLAALFPSSLLASSPDVFSFALGIGAALKSYLKQKHPLKGEQEKYGTVAVVASAHDSHGACPPAQADRHDALSIDLLYFCLVEEIPFSKEPEPSDFRYFAQSTPFHPQDLETKIKRAQSIAGFRFLRIFTPSPFLGKFPPEECKEVSRLAVETGIFPLYEIAEGKYHLEEPQERLAPLSSFFAKYGRGGLALKEIEAKVKENWQFLKKSSAKS